MQLKQDALALLRDKELACHSGPQVIYLCFDYEVNQRSEMPNSRKLFR